MKPLQSIQRRITHETEGSVQSLGRLLQRHDELQDAIVDRVLRPYGLTFAFFCYGFVFFFLGLQKPAPIFTPVRQEVGVFAAQFGIAAMPALLFIGLYEMIMGALFFAKRIRIVFWMFFAHQTVGFLLLIMIPYTVFQPPYLTVLGLDVPWAVGGFSAFVLKNVIFVGGFVLLAMATLGSEN